jgi:hypothetical protein
MNYLLMRFKYLVIAVLLIALALPVVALNFEFDEIVYVKRKTFGSSHFYTDFIDGVHGYGADIVVYDWTTDTETSILPTNMKGGIVGKLDLYWDASKLIFAWKQDADTGFRIYEINIDGTNLTQLTYTPLDEATRMSHYNHGSNIYRHFVDDMHPCYLPNDKIVFVSTRSEYSTLCDAPDLFSSTTLHLLDPSVSNPGDPTEGISMLTNSAVTESHPSVMPDGRILYSRWEYVDKGAVSVKCLWTMNPDGSRSEELVGADALYPNTILFPHVVPGTNNEKIIALGTPHCCPVGSFGTVVKYDLTKNSRAEVPTSMDNYAPLTYITDNVKIPLSGHNGVDHYIGGQWYYNQTTGPLFTSPYPLSEDEILVCYNVSSSYNDYDAYDLYLLNGDNTYELIKGDSTYSIACPRPVQARTRPNVIHSAGNPAWGNKALTIVTNVYDGLEGVDAGTIKYIRLMEQVPRFWAARRADNYGGDVVDQQHACISYYNALGLRVQHGIVPVETDGSAYYWTPSEKNIFLQLLDENYMVVQQERTYVNYMPGEFRSCNGCHERSGEIVRSENVTSGGIVTALTRAPSSTGPQPGDTDIGYTDDALVPLTDGRRPIDYRYDIQPIWDAKCISCHGGSQAPDLRGTETTHFSASYQNLIDGGYVSRLVEQGPKWGNVHYLGPYSYATAFAHNSSLVTTVVKNVHQSVTLTEGEKVRIVTWVDNNSQFYGTYYGWRNTAWSSDPYYRIKPTWENATESKENWHGQW